MLPISVATLLFAALSLLLIRATFAANGDASRWAAISTMLLALPVILGGVFVLAVLIAMSFLIGKGASVIPLYSYRGQRIFSRIEGQAKRLAEMVRRPVLLAQGLGDLVRAGIKRARERM